MDEEAQVPKEVWSKDHERMYDESYFLETMAPEPPAAHPIPKKVDESIPKGPEIGREDVPQSGAPFGVGATIDKKTGHVKPASDPQAAQHKPHVPRSPKHAATGTDFGLTEGDIPRNPLDPTKTSEHLVHKKHLTEEMMQHSPTLKSPKTEESKEKQSREYVEGVYSAPPLPTVEELASSAKRAKEKAEEFAKEKVLDAKATISDATQKAKDYATESVADALESAKQTAHKIEQKVPSGIMDTAYQAKETLTEAVHSASKFVSGNEPATEKLKKAAGAAAEVAKEIKNAASKTVGDLYQETREKGIGETVSDKLHKVKEWAVGSNQPPKQEEVEKPKEPSPNKKTGSWGE